MDLPEDIYNCEDPCLHLSYLKDFFGESHDFSIVSFNNGHPGKENEFKNFKNEDLKNVYITVIKNSIIHTYSIYVFCNHCYPPIYAMHNMLKDHVLKNNIYEEIITKEPKKRKI